MSNYRYTLVKNRLFLITAMITIREGTALLPWSSPFLFFSFSRIPLALQISPSYRRPSENNSRDRSSVGTRIVRGYQRYLAGSVIDTSVVSGTSVIRNRDCTTDQGFPLRTPFSRFFQLAPDSRDTRCPTSDDYRPRLARLWRHRPATRHLVAVIPSRFSNRSPPFQTIHDSPSQRRVHFASFSSLFLTENNGE